jgi:hypothetical protein
LFLDFVRIIFCPTQFLALIRWTKSKSNIPTFDGRETKLIWFELFNKVQSNIPPVFSGYTHLQHWNFDFINSWRNYSATKSFWSNMVENYVWIFFWCAPFGYFSFCFSLMLYQESLLTFIQYNVKLTTSWSLAVCLHHLTMATWFEFF